MLLEQYVRFRNWLSGERGQNMVEYGLIILVIAIGLIVASGPLRTQLTAFFGRVGTCLNLVQPNAQTPPNC